MKDVLLTFTGFHDLYFKGLVDREEQPGPILSPDQTLIRSYISLRYFKHRNLADYFPQWQ
ncbi:MAG: hypothetical protein M0Q23_00830 [Syntrophales bacterium]|jgi:hypothetical protein|nr:hypothetical protein [Syntrophales bacterium]MCK9527193.1 hypothetical protein [Syntrophales bacterium]MDX9921682.1 hypothetical protein [Syntrophales bacterium]